MSIIAAFIFPHPPIIMPSIGKGEEKKIRKTSDCYKKACEMIAQLKPDTIIMSSSHCSMYSDYIHISSADEFNGSLSRFGAKGISVHAEYDKEFISILKEETEGVNLNAGLLGYEEPDSDHASVIPLAFLNEVYTDYKLVRMGISHLPFADHYRFGMCISEVSERLNRRSVFIASGDLSHKLKVFGPYGYAKEGEQYDKIVTEAMAKGNFSKFMDLKEDFLEKAAECGHRTFVIMAGTLDKKKVEADLLSYENTFGVGYAVASFLVKDEVDRKQEVNDKHTEDEYVALARYSIEHYVRNKRVAKLPENLSEELLIKRAGVFVSLKKNGNLRGCIGTIHPVTGSIGEEILRNAVSSCSQDPRFNPVRPEELEELEYSVDVLMPSEKIQSKEQLDVKKYGVIVTSGFKRGLLLPNLEGVDTVDEQIDIALQKAGIERNEKYNMERFEVVRHK